MSENLEPSTRRQLRATRHNRTSTSTPAPRPPLRPLPLVPQAHSSVSRIQHHLSRLSKEPINIESSDSDQEPPVLTQEEPLNLSTTLSEQERIQIELHRTVLVIRDTFRQFRSIIGVYDNETARTRILEVIDHEVRRLHHR